MKQMAPTSSKVLLFNSNPYLCSIASAEPQAYTCFSIQEFKRKDVLHYATENELQNQHGIPIFTDETKAVVCHLDQ